MSNNHAMHEPKPGHESASRVDVADGSRGASATAGAFPLDDFVDCCVPVDEYLRRPRPVLEPARGLYLELCKSRVASACGLMIESIRGREQK